MDASAPAALPTPPNPANPAQRRAIAPGGVLLRAHRDGTRLVAPDGRP